MRGGAYRFLQMLSISMSVFPPPVYTAFVMLPLIQTPMGAFRLSRRYPENSIVKYFYTFQIFLVI